MKLWLTRRRSGRYTLTALPPQPAIVHGTEALDLFLTPGEPIGVENLCPEGIRQMFGVSLGRYESCEVELSATVVPDSVRFWSKEDANC